MMSPIASWRSTDHLQHDKWYTVISWGNGYGSGGTKLL